MANIIGLDIGGTKISGVVWDGKKVIEELTIVTPKNLFEFEKNVLKLADFLSASRNIRGIGVGVAGKVDPKSGVVAYSPNIKFVQDLRLTKLFKLKGFNKVKIDNDSKCFTRAEALLGQGRGRATLVCVTLGTGIGGGLAAAGQVYGGANFAAGEFGHMIYGGNQTFERLYQQARDSHDDAALAEIIGSLLTNIYRVVDPETIVLGGGVVFDRERNFLKRAAAVCAKNLASYKIKADNIKISKLKHAGAVGAALLVK